MKALRILLIIIAVPVVAAASFFIFFMITEYNPDQIVALSAVHDTHADKANPGGLKLLSWNLGYGGLDKHTDFVMEGGTMSGPRNRAAVEDSMSKAADFLLKQEADVCFIQELDRDSDRTWNIDQTRFFSDKLRGYEGYYGINYKCLFVPYPIPGPIAGIDAGLMTLSSYKSSSAERHQLPGFYSWPTRLFHLKRCAVVTRIPSAEEGRDWVLINLHLSAYGDGTMRAQQLEYLKKIMISYYQEGHFVVLGGDWNSMFPGVEKDDFAPYTTDEEYLFWLQRIPKGWTPENWQWCFNPEIPTCRSLEQPYKAGENFTTVIDGFLVSPNLKVEAVEAWNLGFEATDHNPVGVTVSIRQE